MDLVDEELVVGLKAHEYSGEVAWLVEHGAACHLESDVELIGYDIAQCGLSESRRAMEKCMVEGLATHAGRLHEHAEVGHYLLLAAEVVESERPQRFLNVAVAPFRGVLGAVYIEFRHFCDQSLTRMRK